MTLTRLQRDGGFFPLRRRRFFSLSFVSVNVTVVTGSFPSIAHRATEIRNDVAAATTTTLNSFAPPTPWFNPFFHTPTTIRLFAAQVPRVVRGMSTTSSSVVPKIIVVVGTTGVGKTKLGVDLAQHFSGEVINADVMQMYKGLQVATAKVTEEERQGVPHHLMSFLEPHETFSPHEFRKLADEKIQEISARGNLPIVVGGTMYYVQGLLWDHLIGHGGHNGNEAGGGGGSGGGGGGPGTARRGAGRG